MLTRKDLAMRAEREIRRAIRQPGLNGLTMLCRESLRIEKALHETVRNARGVGLHLGTDRPRSRNEQAGGMAAFYAQPSRGLGGIASGRVRTVKRAGSGRGRGCSATTIHHPSNVRHRSTILDG